MGRAPCCDKANVKKGPWSPEEDAKLKDYIEKHGTGGNWIALPHKIGLKRCGKSCRLRWLNYLRPNIKHGEFSDDEDRKICSLFSTIGSRWSIIAAHLPGRTDNDIKNYWNTKLKKKLFGNMSLSSFSSSSSTRQCQQMMHLPQSATNSSLLPYSSNYNNNSFSLQNPSFPLSYPSPYDPNSPIRVFSLGYDDTIPFPQAFTTLIPPYANPNNFEPASCTSSDGSCITHQIGYDQSANLCGFGNPGAAGIDEDQKFMSADFGGFGDEIGTPLENSIEEIKQLITTDNNLNCFVNMDEIKTEF